MLAKSYGAKGRWTGIFKQATRKRLENILKRKFKAIKLLDYVSTLFLKNKHSFLFIFAKPRFAGRYGTWLKVSFSA